MGGRAILTTLAGVAMALTGVPSAAAAQTVREVDPNGLYPAGTVLASPMTGITFRLPEGFRAEWDRTTGALLALSDAGAFGAVWGWSEGTKEEVAGEVGARLAAQGISLQGREGDQVTADALRGVFDARALDGGGIMHVYIQEGPLGGVVAVTGLGEGAAAAFAADFVDSMAGSVEWAVPRAATWRAELTGAVLSRSSVTGGGAGSDGVTGALSFCGASEYRYEDGAGDRHAGTWFLMADLAGQATLHLEGTDGRLFAWPVERSGSGFRIAGVPYAISGRC